MRHERRTCARLCHLAGGLSRLQAETQPSGERQPWTGRHLTRSSRPTTGLRDNCRKPHLRVGRYTSKWITSELPVTRTQYAPASELSAYSPINWLSVAPL